MANLVLAFLPPAAPAAYVFAVLVGLSRVYAGVHYPSDVCAGAVLGHVSADIGRGLVPF